MAVIAFGEVAEWSNAPDLKSGVRKDRGFESHPLRILIPILNSALERGGR